MAGSAAVQRTISGNIGQKGTASICRGTVHAGACPVLHDIVDKLFKQLGLPDADLDGCISCTRPERYMQLRRNAWENGMRWPLKLPGKESETRHLTQGWRKHSVALMNAANNRTLEDSSCGSYLYGISQRRACPMHLQNTHILQDCKFVESAHDEKEDAANSIITTLCAPVNEAHHKKRLQTLTHGKSHC